MYMACQFYLGRFANPAFYGALGVANWKFFLFFATGMLVRKHWATCASWLDGKWPPTLLVVLFLGFTVFLFKQMPSPSTVVSGIYEMGCGVVGSLTVFAFFRRHQASFTKETSLGRRAQYVGSRTLDIYLLHYFFVPRQLADVGAWFAHQNNPALEYAFTVALALVVVAICLVVSNVLRLSPVLGHWLFGAKYADKPTGQQSLHS